jgi:hypothetical protein
VNLNWPREVSTTQFEFMRLSQGDGLISAQAASGMKAA